jgi:hypothetical protein
LGRAVILLARRLIAPSQEALVSIIPTTLSVRPLGRRPPNLPFPSHQHLLAKLGFYQEDICSPEICLAKPEWASPFLELQLTRSGQAEFVICEHTIEEMFGDWKGHGFDLALTRLQHFPRLSRLTLAIALLYLALVTQGARAIKNGQRRLVDRKGRRDLSLFRLGLYLTDRCLACSSRLALHLIPYF